MMNKMFKLFLSKLNYKVFLSKHIKIKYIVLYYFIIKSMYFSYMYGAIQSLIDFFECMHEDGKEHRHKWL